MPIDRALLDKYRRSYNTFIETGTYLGSTVELALETGFERVYSIELSAKLYRHCQQRFGADQRVRLLLGPSEVCLPQLLQEITVPCVIWLDGHYSQGDTALGKKWCPLYEELDAIARHPVKTHTVLIDDIRLAGAEWKDISPAGILTRLHEINPAYEIYFEDDACAPKDILVAVAPL